MSSSSSLSSSLFLFMLLFFIIFRFLLVLLLLLFTFPRSSSSSSLDIIISTFTSLSLFLFSFFNNCPIASLNVFGTFPLPFAMASKNGLATSSKCNWVRDGTSLLSSSAYDLNLVQQSVPLRRSFWASVHESKQSENFSTLGIVAKYG